MTENKDKDKDNEKDKEKEKEQDRGILSHFVDSFGNSLRERALSTFGDVDLLMVPPSSSSYKSSIVSVTSEILRIDLQTGELNRLRPFVKDETTIGTQRVYKKTSPNSVLTLYLPTREIISCGTQPAILKGIVYADTKLIEGCRVYAQLTLTFRYGREDEEVMGLRFCNEAIMSLHQLWPRTDEPTKDSLSPLQDALLKRLGIDAHPFTLSLTPQSPPSVQLVPAKRYYGAPIGTSYDIRCFIADKTDEKFHRRASVKMGVRVIHRTDVFSASGPENFAALLNNQSSPPPAAIQPDNSAGGGGGGILPPPTDIRQQSHLTSATTIPPFRQQTDSTLTNTTTTKTNSAAGPANLNITETQTPPQIVKHKKSERVDSFPKIRLSPKSFRFSGRFGRSKSEVERSPGDPFHNYSKSFQEVDKYDGTGGPQGAVDKPFLLQEGRVGLRASLNKSWYTHGEDVIVTVSIKNDSKKTVRRMRVCAIQHVDVCMFNNGKFKNIVADSDDTTNSTSTSSTDQTSVGPGKTLNSKFILRPKRGPTKNWIALEDSLQRSSEPDEITGSIAASAVRLPHVNPIGTSSSSSPSPLSTCVPDDRNVFAIYVSYYVKVKLTLSGMGGELSLKLPFSLVHIESSSSPQFKPIPSPSTPLSASAIKQTDIEMLAESLNLNRITIDEVHLHHHMDQQHSSNILGHDVKNLSGSNSRSNNVLNKIESIEDEIQITISSSPFKIPEISTKTATETDISCMDDDDDSAHVGPVVIRSTGGISKRKLVRSITIEKDLSDEEITGKDENVIMSTEKLPMKNCDDSMIVEKCDENIGAAGIRLESAVNLDTGGGGGGQKQQQHQQTTCAQVHSSSSHL